MSYRWQKTLTIWFSPSWPAEFYWNSAIFYLIDVQQHVLTACRNFFSHWHKRDNSSNSASALHLYSIISAQALRLRKLNSHLSQSWSHMKYPKMLGWKWCKHLEVLTHDYRGISMPSWDWLNCEISRSLADSILSLCSIVAETHNCFQLQTNVRLTLKRHVSFFLWSTDSVCPIKMPSVHSISRLATFSIMYIVGLFDTILVVKFSFLTRWSNWDHQVTKWAHVVLDLKGQS